MTRDVFNQIAQGWYNYRHWTIFRNELEMLAKRWQGGRLLNIGCAHGPDFLPFQKGFELHGVDFSQKMLEFARQYSQKFDFPVALYLADAVTLPFRDGVFDWALSVATYHHITNKKDRKVALLELRRVLKPGGEAFITVWNRWQPRFWFSAKNTTVPWRTGDRTLYRYYYLYSYRELQRLVKDTGFQVLQSFPEYSYRLPVKLFSRNICLLVKKQ